MAASANLSLEPPSGLVSLLAAPGTSLIGSPTRMKRGIWGTDRLSQMPHCAAPSPLFCLGKRVARLRADQAAPSLVLPASVAPGWLPPGDASALHWGSVATQPRLYAPVLAIDAQLPAVL